MMELIIYIFFHFEVEKTNCNVHMQIIILLNHIIYVKILIIMNKSVICRCLLKSNEVLNYIFY